MEKSRRPSAARQGQTIDFPVEFIKRGAQILNYANGRILGGNIATKPITFSACGFDYAHFSAGESNSPSHSL
jgi:hypothetical protein